MTKKEPAKNKLKSSSAILVIGVLLLAIGGLIFANRYQKTHKIPGLPSAEQTVTTDVSEPEESKPAESAVKNYSVPDDQPRSISIKSVGISGLIQKVGITKDNAMAVPSNIHFAGWYVNSVKPGEAGLSIINGHVLGTYTDAIFKQLAKVKPYDEIEIEFGDKSIRRFEVVETVALPADKSAARLFTQNPDILSQLNLITCTGKFDKTSQTYEDRVIVITKSENLVD